MVGIVTWQGRGVDTSDVGMVLDISDTKSHQYFRIRGKTAFTVNGMTGVDLKMIRISPKAAEKLIVEHGLHGIAQGWGN